MTASAPDYAMLKRKLRVHMAYDCGCYQHMHGKYCRIRTLHEAYDAVERLQKIIEQEKKF